MAINPHVLCEVVNTLCEQGDLNLWGATVLLVKAKPLEYGLSFLFNHYRIGSIAEFGDNVNLFSASFAFVALFGSKGFYVCDGTRSVDMQKAAALRSSGFCSL
jgi:hypothetical protein